VKVKIVSERWKLGPTDAFVMMSSPELGSLGNGTHCLFVPGTQSLT
jgi:hypothetical protein